jgi:uncharacterized membrane protein YccC
VTLLVVIGGLQHHGNIRKKAAERALGTLLGAGLGLSLIVIQAVSGSTFLTLLLTCVIAGGCAYYAIGKAGYVALLTAITMVIVSGHGDQTIDVGLWRTANVLIGIVIALAFSFVLPQYATYSWRYRLADNLREAARLYAAMLDGAPLAADELTRRFLAMSARLVQSRSLLDSVAKETDVPVDRLEEIQRLHRSIVAALEMLASALPQVAAKRFAADRRVLHTLLLMARALRFGRVGLLHTPREASVAGPGMVAVDGPEWLTARFAEQVDTLRMRLIEIERQWNIESARPFHR